MDANYQRFLRAGDLATWTECLAAAEKELSGSPRDARQLAQGVCIATYVLWLGRHSGDDRAQKTADRLRDRFFAQIGASCAEDLSPDGKYANAVVLASAGFSRLAERTLPPGAISPDVALMVMPSDPARRTAALREMALDPARGSFPPTFYFYCETLLRLGRMNEVERLIGERRCDPSDPFIADLLGTIHERAGRWNEARRVYQRSSWPIHRMRAAVCARVGRTDDGFASDADLEQHVTRQALAQLETEIDQLELARMSAFVNACRWNAVEGWLVDFELGKLSFRRRRYWEAEEYLRTAEASCPPTALFAIRRLRFYSLTWLSSGRDGATPLLPEAIEAGLGALEAADQGDDDEDIRLWIARETHEHRLLHGVFESADDFSRAEAYRLVGDTERERATLLSLATSAYTPRAIYRLIEWFAAARFYRTADVLTGVVLEESADDFFALWELGSALLRVSKDLEPRSASRHALAARIRSVSARLQQLSRSDFQHLIRAFEFYADQRRDDLAELVLSRAAALAEGAEENLAVASARSSRSRFVMGEGQDEGLACLLRAEREARCLIERLRVAHEYFAYGRIQRARSILVSEGVFDEGRRMTDIEYVTALQCGQWLEPVEFQALARNAVATTSRNVRAGVRRRCELLFIQRLINTIAAVNPSFAKHLILENGFRVVERPAEQVEASSALTSEGRSDVAAPATNATSDVPAESVEPLRRLFAERPSAALTMWAETLEHIKRWESDGLGPISVDADATPICKSTTLHTSRAAELEALWHEFAAASGDEQEDIRRRIRVFHEAERHRLDEWERQRRSQAAPALQRQVDRHQQAVALLQAIVAGRLFADAPSPLIRDVASAIASDASACIEDLERQRVWMLARLRDGEGATVQSDATLPPSLERPHAS